MVQNPEDSFVQHALALEYIKLNRVEEAKQAFETLLAKDENYVGSYYHLAKLLERAGDIQGAIKCYEKGMQVAKTVGDKHAYNELQAAHEDLIY